VAYFCKYVFQALWIAWATYWWVLARDVKATQRHEPLAARLIYTVPLMLAILLYFANRISLPILGERFLPSAPWQFWIGLLFTAAGLLFSVWARRHLGRNWSGTVTIKKDHELIMTGPYAMVRHPIYTGLLLAFVGATIARGEWRAILALILCTGSFWWKLRREERWMRETFGDEYRAYSQRVAALVPFLL